MSAITQYLSTKIPTQAGSPLMRMLATHGAEKFSKLAAVKIVSLNVISNTDSVVTTLLVILRALVVSTPGTGVVVVVAITRGGLSFGIVECGAHSTYNPIQFGL